VKNVQITAWKRKMCAMLNIIKNLDCLHEIELPPNHQKAHTPTVFLSTGSTRLKFLGSFLGLKFPNPSPTTKKLRP
jgi:hypothetical protein